ncbi:MAG: hypothetical protein EAZ91_24140 [Cytophagales bacterium]|nr:MAG: hypothetical protein EAZ91_24140 [Cytophagales bacterium]
MNPDKRFGQIEEILVEVLHKQDEHTAQIKQLANTSGKILEVALDAKDLAGEAKEIAISARGAAIEARDVAIEARDVATEAKEIAQRVERKVDMTAEAVAKLTVDTQTGFARVDEQFGEVNKQFGEVNKQFGEVNKQFDAVNGRLDDLMDFLKERLK